MSALLERYHELLGFRREALARYRCNELTVIGGPPSHAYFPLVTLGGAETDADSVRASVGPVRVLDRPPVARFAERIVRESNRPLTIVEVGPGTGLLAARLQRSYGEKIRAYYGIELDPNVEGPYRRVASLEAVGEPVDLFIASEVAEHMLADRWYAEFLEPLRRHASDGARALVSVPNPVGPGTYARDFSHVQPYPWYDLYAITRLAFDDVQIVRALYVWSLQRLLTLVPRIVLCSMIEMDWCDNVICIASKVRREP